MRLNVLIVIGLVLEGLSLLGRQSAPLAICGLSFVVLGAAQAVLAALSPPARVRPAVRVDESEPTPGEGSDARTNERRPGESDATWADRVSKNERAAFQSRPKR